MTRLDIYNLFAALADAAGMSYRYGPAGNVSLPDRSYPALWLEEEMPLVFDNVQQTYSVAFTVYDRTLEGATDAQIAACQSKCQQWGEALIGMIDASYPDILSAAVKWDAVAFRESSADRVHGARFEVQLLAAAPINDCSNPLASFVPPDLGSPAIGGGGNTDADIAALEARVDALVLAVDDLQAFEAAQQAANSATNATLASLQASIDSATATLASLQAQVTDLQTDVAANAAAIAAANDAIATVEAALASLQALYDDIDARLTTAEYHITLDEAAIDALQVSVTSINTSLTSLLTRMGTAEGNITTLQGSVSTLQSSVTSLQSLVSSLQSAVTALQNTDTTQNSRLTSLETRMTTAEGNITSNSTAITNEATARANADTALQSQITTNTANIATNTSNIATNTSAISTNTTNIATNTSAISALKAVTRFGTYLQGDARPFVSPFDPYGMLHTASTLASLTGGPLNTLNVFLFSLPMDATVDGLHYRVSTGVSNATISFAIYDVNSSGTPTTRKYNFGDFSASASGVYDQSFSAQNYALTAGTVYALAIYASSSSLVVTANSGNNIRFVMWGNTFTPLVTLAASSASVPLPTNWPGTASTNSSFSPLPAVAFYLR